jgi:hypothetical protein
VYAVLLGYPKDPSKIILGAIESTEATQISMLGSEGKIQWVAQPSGGIALDISEFDYNHLPSEWALTFKISNVS